MRSVNYLKEDTVMIHEYQGTRMIICDYTKETVLRVIQVQKPHWILGLGLSSYFYETCGPVTSTKFLLVNGLDDHIRLFNAENETYPVIVEGKYRGGYVTRCDDGKAIMITSVENLNTKFYPKQIKIRLL